MSLRVNRPTRLAALWLAALPCVALAGGASPVAPAAAPLPTHGVLRDLVAGDRGCYLSLEDAAGKRQELLADFDLCTQRAAIGARVRLAYREESVAAESCQGAPDCSQSERVSLVVELHVER